MSSGFQSLNAHNFHHALSEGTGISLVFFTHAGCSSCRAWHELLLLFQQQNPAINLYHVNAQEEMALTNEFEIFHLPALFLYNNGEYHAPFECVADLQSIDNKISELLAQPGMDMP